MHLPPHIRQAVISAYGPPDRVQIALVPSRAPGPDEMLVRVTAAPVTAGDVRMRSGKVPRGMGIFMRLALGWHRPRNPPGWSYAGRVLAMGSAASGFAPGQHVFGITGIKGGAHADHVAVRPAGPVFPLPEGLSHAEGAAFFFGGLTALDFLVNKAKLQPGERLLIQGATGSVGSAAIQIAKFLGAEVTAVASRANHALARSLGADATQDYRDGPPKGEFDVVMDVMGTLGWTGARALLARGGRLVLITADLPAMLGAVLRPRRAGRRVIAGTASEAKAQMERLIALYETGGYRPVVGQVLPFADLAAAHEIAETFHKPGNLVVEM